MEPADPSARPVLPFLAPGSQTAWYLPWLKVSLALRMALTYSWDANAWTEVREHIPWLLAERSCIRRAGWFN